MVLGTTIHLKNGEGQRERGKIEISSTAKTMRLLARNPTLIRGRNTHCGLKREEIKNLELSLSIFNFSPLKIRLRLL